MSESMCPQCHNTSFRFDANRHAIVCTVCGSPRNSIDNASEMLEYDRNRQKAIAFVKTNDYSSALPFLERMRQAHPDDPDIYYLHIMGLTNCCKNYHLSYNDCKSAQKYWCAFEQLGGDKTVFIRYMHNRKKELLDTEETQIAKSTRIIIIALIAIIVSSIFCLMKLYVFFIGIAGGIFAIIKKRCFQKIWSAKKKQKSIQNAETPFFGA